jgi:hypothetical protein
MSVTIKDNKVNLDSLMKGLKELDKKAVIVGVMKEEDSKIQVIASANEFGATIKSKKAIRYFWFLMSRYKKYIDYIKQTRKTGGKSGGQSIVIPERSYIRSTFDDREVQNKIVETMAFYLSKALKSQNTFPEVLTRAGNYLQRMIQARMEGTTPENHPLTVRMKGHDTPLKGRNRKLMKAIKSKLVDK